MTRAAIAPLLALALTTTSCPAEPCREVEGGPHCPRDAGGALTPWPGLPRDAKSTAALFTRNSFVRAAESPPEISSAAALLDLVDSQAQKGNVMAGWDAIVGFLQKRLDKADASSRMSAILWGVHFDAAAQQEAFRRLYTPGGLRTLTVVVVEQLAATGRWSDVEPALQAGDSADIDAYLESGDSAAWFRLYESQRRSSAVAREQCLACSPLELVATARSQGQRLLGCDLPLALQQSLTAGNEEWLEHLREMHCMRALVDEFDRTPRTMRAAILLGQNHVKPDAIPRLLPSNIEVTVLYVFGGRPAGKNLEDELAAQLGLIDPLLVPLDNNWKQLVLLLPEAPLALQVERKTDALAQPAPVDQQQHAMLRSDEPGTLFMGGRTLELSKPVNEKLGAGVYPFLFKGRSGRIAGALPIATDGFVEVELKVKQRQARQVVHQPDAK